MSYILFGGTRDERNNCLAFFLDTAPTLSEVLMPLKPDFTAEEFIEDATTTRVRRIHDDTTQWFHITCRRVVEWWQVLNTETNKLATFGGRCWTESDFPRAILMHGDNNRILFEQSPVRSVRPTDKDLRVFMGLLTQADLDGNPQQMYVNRKARQAQRDVAASMANAVRACTSA